jgi:hypothetical protein
MMTRVSAGLVLGALFGCGSIEPSERVTVLFEVTDWSPDLRTSQPGLLVAIEARGNEVAYAILPDGDPLRAEVSADVALEDCTRLSVQLWSYGYEDQFDPSPGRRARLEGFPLDGCGTWRMEQSYAGDTVTTTLERGP